MKFSRVDLPVALSEKVFDMTDLLLSVAMFAPLLYVHQLQPGKESSSHLAL